MFLKEIDFDLPYIPNENNIDNLMKQRLCERSEATKIDYNQNWKTKRRNFTLQTRCVSSMFERIMGKINVENCKKLLIECVPDDYDLEIKNFSGVCSCKVKFDYNNFILIDELNKKKKILDTIMKGVKILSNYEAINYEKFDFVYHEIVKLNYDNNWVWKEKFNHNNKYLAKLIIKHDINSVLFYVDVFDNVGKLFKSKCILNEIPDEYSYLEYLGDFYWRKNKVILENKRGTKKITVTI